MRGVKPVSIPDASSKAPACGPAGRAGEQVRVDHQRRDRPDARPNRAATRQRAWTNRSLPPPALGKGCHGGLSGRSIPVRFRGAILVATGRLNLASVLGLDLLLLL